MRRGPALHLALPSAFSLAVIVASGLLLIFETIVPLALARAAARPGGGAARASGRASARP